MKTSFCAPGFVMLRYLMLFLSVFITHFSLGQLNNNSKLSPVLLNEITKGKIAAKPIELEVTFLNGKIPIEIFRPHYKAQKLFESAELSIYRVFATVKEIDSIFLPLPGVIFIENGDRKAKEELIIGNLDLSVNKINLVHRNYSSINGDGIVVSVKENKPDTADIDLKGRFLSTTLSSGTVNSHATIMSTIMAGGGNSWHLGKGAAWGSTISSSSFAVLLPDANSAYQQYNISVQNHSYGV